MTGQMLPLHQEGGASENHGEECQRHQSLNYTTALPPSRAFCFPCESGKPILLKEDGDTPIKGLFSLFKNLNDRKELRFQPVMQQPPPD